ncbi:MAG: DUF4399 domain-containing protein [Gammaproteobacteria bacterium]
MNTSTKRVLLLTALGLAIAGCGKPPAAPAEAPPAVPAAVEAPAMAAPADMAGAMPRSPSPAGASVVIVSPANGAIVSSPVKVVFGLEGMAVAAAGDLAPNSGHHHLLVDVAAPDLGQLIPKDAQHLHFGKGQTEAEIPLEPGQHTLQLLLGDTNHVPHDPPLISAPITITVQ